VNTLLHKNVKIIEGIIVDDSKQEKSLNNYFFNNKDLIDVCVDNKIIRIKKIEKYSKNKENMNDEELTNIFNKG